MRGEIGKRLLPYAVALLSVGLAVLSTMLIAAISNRFNLALFYAAIILTTWYGGLRPGLLAIALSILASNYFFVAPDFSLAVDLAGLVQLAVFLLVALLISSLTTARRRAEANSHLYKTEQVARQNAERTTKHIASLQAVTAALSQALTPAQIAEVTVTQGLPALDAVAGMIALLTSGRNEFEIVSSAGLPTELLDAWRRFPTTAPLPMADAVRLNKPLFLEAREATTLLDPELFSSRPLLHHAWAVMPLTLDNRALGVMTLHFPEPHNFSREERDLMLTFAQQCTQAIERAQLYQAEQQARSKAEAVQERLTRMQAVIAELGQALTPFQIAQVIITQGPPVVGASAGLIALAANGGGVFEIISYVGYASEKLDPWRRFPATPGLPIPDVVRRRQPLFLDSRETAATLYPELVAQRETEHEAWAVIPLLGESQTLGAMTLSFPEARVFSLEDREFMLTLSQQCAQALERAQLYAELEQRVQERTAELRAANQKLEAEIAERQQLTAELAEVHRRLMESREEERVRLAQDLHDGPVQELYSLIYRLSGLTETLPDETGRIELATAQTTIQSVIGVLRTTFTELRPPVLASFGLERAIHAHAEEFKLAHPELELQLELQPDGQKLPEGMRLALFRIYQAALANIIRHAQAQHVFIRFSLNDQEIVLEIKDDGRGFEVPQRWVKLARQGHLGLVGMSERAGAIGGQLQVISTPGAGTIIRAIIPRATRSSGGSAGYEAEYHHRE